MGRYNKHPKPLEEANVPEEIKEIDRFMEKPKMTYTSTNGKKVVYKVVRSKPMRLFQSMTKKLKL